MIAVAILGLVVLAPVVSARMLFLATTRLGWLNYLANIFGEVFVKKLRLNRFAVEAIMALTGLVLLKLGGLDWSVVLLAALSLALIEILVRRFENRLLKDAWTRQDSIGPFPGHERARNLALAYPSPSTHPQLTVNLVAPFTQRAGRYRLGTLVVGRVLELRVLVGNHTIVPTQTAVRVSIRLPDAIRCEGDTVMMVPVVHPGEVAEVIFRVAVTGSSGPAQIAIQVEWGDISRELGVHVDRCVSAGSVRIESARIERYPGACRSAFALRGDMDLYDTSTLQSIDGLEVTLSLAARYRLPQTMYLSTRLSLDEASARAYGEHFGVDRGADQIPRFVQWMKDNVELVHQAGYPFAAGHRFVIELGNHGHLHFGTDASAAAENGWKVRTKMGAGVYPWLREDRSSFAEQRDNALEARRWCETTFGYTPRSWAMPDRTRDEHTPRAMEAAGCEVLSDSDVRTIHNVLLQPPPHFPPGCTAVELTKRYPGDPHHVFHVAMNLFWIHRAHRLAIPVVFMCHQHMRQFEGYGCARYTETILRHVVHDMRGDMYINTVYGIGVYWRDVLSPQAKSVSVEIDGGVARVSSSARHRYDRVPVDVTLSGGWKATYLVDVAPGDVTEVGLLGPAVTHDA